MNNFNISIEDDSFHLDEIIEFLAKIYGPNYFDARRIQGAILRNEPSTRPENFIIARSEQKDLIGLVRIVERNIHLGSAILNCGGISSVSIHPDWRGRGIMREIMKTAHEEMTRRGMDIAYLYGRRAMDGYYAQFGYYGINRYLDLEIISPILGKPRLTVASFNPKNIEQVRKSYYETYSSLAGSVLRNERVWSFLISKIDEAKGQTELLELDSNGSGDMVGYIVLSQGRIIEISVPGLYYQDILVIMKERGVKYISIHPHHPFHAYVRMNFSSIQHERLSLDGGYQGKILNTQTLLKTLYSNWHKVATQIGVNKEKINIFGLEVDLESGHISGSSYAADVIFEKQGNEIHFILGLRHLEAYSGIHMNPDKPWLKYFFVSTGFYTSALDEI